MESMSPKLASKGESSACTGRSCAIVAVSLTCSERATTYDAARLQGAVRGLILLVSPRPQAPAPSLRPDATTEQLHNLTGVALRVDVNELSETADTLHDRQPKLAAVVSALVVGAPNQLRKDIANPWKCELHFLG